ncbi:hypothetical protein [Synechococcus sp. CC9605]|uniref:hypothetical protein n=1 Tax=Synechococcus sp. (strain CC9605) TaxID=110662 RepID=UPI00005D5721|nr:hypothetical protein [Synechococcus sp. CC9605]ABB34233.1 hypothetical protein Syncc9605_0457 [Synechococcus sp. CC9605]
MTTTARRRKKPVRANVEEEILERGRWSGLKEQHRLERQNQSEVENEMARIQMQQFLVGGTSAITPDGHGGWPGG